MQLLRIAPGEDEHLVLEILGQARASAVAANDARGVNARASAAELRHTREADGTILAVRNGREWFGLATLVRRDWDSRHFAMEVHRLGVFAHRADPTAARLLAKGVVDAARGLHTGLVHAWLPLEDIAGLRALEAAGFRIADVLTTFGSRLDGVPVVAPSGREAVRLRSAEPGDEQTLVDIANHIYERTPDRFHTDSHFSPALANGVYAQWMLNSCRGQLADEVLVAEIDGAPAGFATVRLDRHPIIDDASRTAGIPLVGVAHAAEGRGLASALVAGALQWMKKHDVTFGHIGTQANNYAMQKLLPRLGMHIFRVGPSLHLWLQAGAS